MTLLLITFFMLVFDVFFFLLKTKVCLFWLRVDVGLFYRIVGYGSQVLHWEHFLPNG